MIYGLAEVAQRLELTHRAIRFYEEQGLISASRDRRGRRRFDRNAQDRLAIIKTMRGAGLGLPQVREVLGVADREARRGRMVELLDHRLGELQAACKAVETAIAEVRCEAPARPATAPRVFDGALTKRQA